MSEPIGIAGAGRVGMALARALRDAGAPVVAVASRRGPVRYEELPAVASRLLIAVPDSALDGVAATLASTARGGVALHTCGARGPDALGALAARGVACGTLHPLQTFAIPRPDLLRGIAFAVAGDPAATQWAEEIAATAGGTAIRVPPGAEPVYHAAAVMASNYLVALIDAARSLMAQAGVDPEALNALIRTTIENVLTEGPDAALTGPIERGDAATVASHLAVAGDLADLYRAAGHRALGIARRRGLVPERAAAIEEILRRMN